MFAQTKSRLGLSGIVAAARYLQRHPESNLSILEQDDCVGGVWSKRRNFAGFWTQTAYGIAEFADFPMERPPEEDSMHGLFRAKYTGKYLEDYVDYINIGGRSLRDRIRFNVHVQHAEKRDDLWHLICTGPDGKSNVKSLTASRLMVANGQASAPRMPELPGRDLFNGRVIHSLDFGQSNVTTDDNVQYITVLGGGKSAADMVYECVKAGKTVTWVIRKTDDGSTGPAFFAPADTPTPYQSPGYMAQTRVISSLQPCYLNPDTWWAWFLHRTRFGTSIVKWIFDQADLGIRKRAAYKDRESTKGFEKLEYESSYGLSFSPY
jgi:dimethylaniline monooxygenase (N-oxide forming)